MKRLLVFLTLMTLSNIVFSQTPVIEAYEDIEHYKQVKFSDIEKQNNLNKAEYPLNDNYYNFFSGAALSLGRGFSPYYMEDVKQSPFDFEFENTEGLGAYSTSFDVQIVFNKYQLEKSLDFDLKMDARIFSTKVNAYLQIIEKTTFDESSLCVVIKASCEYGRTSLKNLVLKKEAEKLAKSDPDRFKSIYGSKFPIMIKRGSSIYFVLKISDVDKTLMNSLNAGLSASYSGLTVSGSLEIKLRKELKSHTVDKNLNISILATGGGGFSELSDIIGALQSTPDAENSFLKIRDGLSKYFKTFNFENAATIGYFCADYRDVSSKLKSILPDFYTIDKEKCLASIINLYRAKEKELEHLSLILSKIDPIAYYLPKEDLTVKFPKYINAIRLYQDSLRRLHLSLSQKSPTATPTNPTPTEFSQVSIPLMTDIPLWNEIAVNISYDNSANKPLNINGKYFQQIQLYFDSYSPGTSIGDLVSSVDFLNNTPTPVTGITLNVEANGKTKVLIDRSFIKNKSEQTLKANTSLGDIADAKKEVGSELILVVKTRYGTEKVIRIGRIRSNGLAGGSRSFTAEFYQNIE